MIYKYFVKSTVGITFVDIWDDAKLIVRGKLGCGYALNYDFAIDRNILITFVYRI